MTEFEKRTLLVTVTNLERRCILSGVAPSLSQGARKICTSRRNVGMSSMKLEKGHAVGPDPRQNTKLTGDFP